MPTRDQYRSYLQRPQVRATLDTIAWAEGANYNTLFGGGTFNDYSRHPNRAITAGRYTSTAAGRYQILKGTWDELGLPDFSPANQDIAALMLINRRGVLDNVVSGDFEGALTSGGLGKEWASLPYSPYGQTLKTPAQVMSYYRSRSGGVAGQASTPAIYLWALGFLGVYLLVSD